MLYACGGDSRYEFNLSIQRNDDSKDESGLKLSGDRAIFTGGASTAGVITIHCFLLYMDMCLLN
ncbi:MAG: hypothetical protein ABI675_23875 [Chitinophagaceae bacterium]